MEGPQVCIIRLPVLICHLPYNKLYSDKGGIIPNRGLPLPVRTVEGLGARLIELLGLLREDERGQDAEAEKEGDENPNVEGPVSVLDAVLARNLVAENTSWARPC